MNIEAYDIAYNGTVYEKKCTRRFFLYITIMTQMWLAVSLISVQKMQENHYISSGLSRGMYNNLYSCHSDKSALISICAPTKALTFYLEDFLW